jgi:hypothetical protein
MQKKILPILVCIIIAAVTVEVVMPAVALHNARQALTYKQYLKNKYPLISDNGDFKKYFQSLDYFTYPNPEVTNNTFALNGAENLAPGKLYCLPYVYPCGNVKGGYYFRNNYLKNNLSAAKYYNGFPSYSNVEITHNSWYQEPGLYFYLASGSGIYLNLGKTLIAVDKLDAMHKLGLSNMYIFKHTDIIYYNHGVFGWTINDLYNLAQKKNMSLKQYINYIFNVKNEQNDYKLSFISSQPSYDNLIYLNAKKQGYDTVQFTAQRNGVDGWGFEIMDIRPGFITPIEQKWQIEEKYLTIRNPFNLQQAEACKLKIPFTKNISCAGQV